MFPDRPYKIWICSKKKMKMIFFLNPIVNKIKKISLFTIQNIMLLDALTTNFFLEKFPVTQLQERFFNSLLKSLNFKIGIFQ